MRSKPRDEQIAPDEIFLDAHNLPQFNTAQFDGRIEQPITQGIVKFFGILFLLIGGILLWKVTILQAIEGSEWTKKAETNRLEHALVFPARGLIEDKNDSLLAWNVPIEGSDFLGRSYTATSGFSHILGYLHYPKADKKGIYFRTTYESVAGIERTYDKRLSGKNGIRIIETDALGDVTSENILEVPQNGETIRLGIDARVQAKLYDIVKNLAKEKGFAGGAGGIIDLQNGELLSLASYPEYDTNVMTNATNTTLISEYIKDDQKLFLNRAVSGLYAPGSIVKPIVALAALTEKTITPTKQIFSSGSLKIPNPYHEGEFSVFNDWKAHGWLDMRSAIAWSSNVYFYELGGGLKGEQVGLGIARLEKYANLFGFGTTTGIDIDGEASGLYPSPSWKEKVFNGDPWRLGDTYFTSIGQYGVQITPLQALKEAGLIANRGRLMSPHLVKSASPNTIHETILPIPDEYFTVIHEGMRQGVLLGTAAGLNNPNIHIAAKTGTAELGVSKKRVNSWVLGFFPYEKPRYAFALVMERGIKGNTFGATYAMRQLVDWMEVETPEYFGGKSKIRPKNDTASSTDNISTTTDIFDIDETPGEEATTTTP